MLLDAKADLLVYGNGERAIVEIAHRLAAGEAAGELRDLRGTAFSRPTGPPPEGWTELDSREVDTPGRAGAADRSLRRHDARAGARRRRV